MKIARKLLMLRRPPGSWRLGQALAPRVAAAFLAASWGLLAAVAAFLLAALFQLPQTTPAPWVEVSLDTSRLQPWRGVLYGVIENGLPAYRTSWDGTPPRAEIVDRRTGEVLAPSVLGRASLEANRNAVLWLQADAEQLTRESCEVMIEARHVRERGPFLALRLEVPPTAGFGRWAFLAVLLIGAAAVFRGAAKVIGAEPGARLGALAASGRTALFLALAATSFAAHFPGPPWFGPETDVASINSFAAALDHPESFERDALLDQRRDFDWYIPLFVGMVRGVGRLGLPYSITYSVLGFLGVWLGLAGYERLFSRISRSALFGLVAALAVMLLEASYPPNEHWAFTTVLPRSLFSSLVPWVLLLALRFLGPRPAPAPRSWWIAAALAAALFYVHPVSSPALSGALFMGYLSVEGVRLRERLLGLLSALAATLLIMLPYALRYGAARQAAESGGQGVEILRTIIAPFEPRRFYLETLHLVMSTPRYWVLLAGLALVLVVRPAGTRLFLGMLAGWAVVTFALPALDWALAEKLGRQPFQFNLVRNLRYLDVWLLATLAFLARAGRRGPLGSARMSADLRAGPARLAARSRLAGAALVASAVAVLCYLPSVVRTLGSVAGQIGSSRAALLGRWRAVPSARLEALRAVQSFRASQETVLSARDLDFFRQFRIPLAYTWKDPETLSYAAGGELVRAKRIVEREEELLAAPVDPSDALALRAATGAEILVIERWRTSLALRESRSRLFQNDRYVVVRPSLDESRGIH